MVEGFISGTVVTKQLLELVDIVTIVREFSDLVENLDSIRVIGNISEDLASTSALVSGVEQKVVASDNVRHDGREISWRREDIGLAPGTENVCRNTTDLGIIKVTVSVDLGGVRGSAIEADPVVVVGPDISPLLTESKHSVRASLSEGAIASKGRVGNAGQRRGGGVALASVGDLDGRLQVVVPAGVETVAAVLAILEGLFLLVPELTTVAITHELLVFKLTGLHGEVLFIEELLSSSEGSNQSGSKSEAHFFERFMNKLMNK